MTSSQRDLVQLGDAARVAREHDQRAVGGQGRMRVDVLRSEDCYRAVVVGAVVAVPVIAGMARTALGERHDE